MNARTEAAAKALNGYTGDCRCDEGYSSRRLIDPACCYHEAPNHEAAADILKAADTVMFSDDAIERAARALMDLMDCDVREDSPDCGHDGYCGGHGKFTYCTEHDSDEWIDYEAGKMCRFADQQARAVIAALKGDEA